MHRTPPRVLAMVLAGGEGKRLLPLTAQRAKPAVPVAGHYRLIDFVLSNLANASYTKIVVLTQYKSHSLDSHIAEAWRLSPILGHYVVPVPAQMRLGKRWFQGSADAIYQNLNIIADEKPDYVCVFSADHIYRMDPRQMVDAHIASGAGVTVAAVRQPRAEAFRFGVIETEPSGSITDFLEKPAEVRGLADDPDQILASMGNYVFSTDVLVEALRADAKAGESGRDLGGDIIPNLVRSADAVVYDFADNDIPGAQPRTTGYWRDVGTIDAYWEAHMDLIDPEPVLDLYNPLWPIHTGNTRMPPAKFVHDEKGRRGEAVSSLVCAGSIVSGGSVRRSVLSPGTFVHSYAEVDGSVILHGADIGRGAVVRHAIVDKGAQIEPGASIGVDAAADEARFAISEGGIAIVPKGARVGAS